MAGDLRYIVVRWREYRQQLSQPGGSQESSRRDDMGADSTKVRRGGWGGKCDLKLLEAQWDCENT